METFVERVCWWADGTSCDIEELSSYLNMGNMSDDYIIVDYVLDADGNLLETLSVPRLNSLDI